MNLHVQPALDEPSEGQQSEDGVVRPIGLEPYQILVVDPQDTLAGRLIRGGEDGSLVGATIRAARNVDDVGPWVAAELVVMALHAWDFSALTWAAELRAQNPDSELLFFAMDTGGPQIAVANSLGVRCIVQGEVGLRWICGNAGALAQVARRRGALRRALALLPPPPWGSEDADRAHAATEVLPPMRNAETRFRETYLRAVFAHADDRHHAAKLAGVPYRTLCAMMQKLGFDPDA